MKKILLMIGAIILMFGGQTVLAENEPVYKTVEPVKYAETYPGASVRPFTRGKTLEETLVECWENVEVAIDITEYKVLEADLAEVYRVILFNNPTMYHVNTGFRYLIDEQGFVVGLAPNYIETDKKVVADTIRGIKEATEEVLMYVDESMTDFEKVMAVHDYMVLHYEYDYTYTNYDASIMITKTGVCMAYARAFKVLMNELGIECLYVSSPTEMDHGWNLVMVDGEWYHIDLTWDDPGNTYGQVRHNYALLSDYEIRNLPNPHYGYDLNGVEATSDKYDKSPWHQGVGAIVTIDGVCYYAKGDSIVDENDNIIYEGLSSKYGWSIGSGYYIPSEVFAGLGEHNGILYFNTDNAVYSYNPKDGTLEKFLEFDGLCGLFIDGNTLSCCIYDMEEENFVKVGEVALGTIRFGGTLHKDGKITKRIYTEADAEDFNVLASCDDCVQVKRVSEPGLSKISFDEEDNMTLFFWNDNLKPLKDKEVYNP